uniref:CCHC-type domain-containing protein n=1 Tax=Anopheles epiroticus TaxID=199890 RepID=A0A182PX74_9DIPT
MGTIACVPVQRRELRSTQRRELRQAQGSEAALCDRAKDLNLGDKPGTSRLPSKANSSKRAPSTSSSMRAALERLEREQALQVKVLMAEKEKIMAEAELKSRSPTKHFEGARRKRFGAFCYKRSDGHGPQASSSEKPVPPNSQRVATPREGTMAAHEGDPISHHIAARQAWPKKLPTFSGIPREWPKFYNYFVESTKACGLSPAENAARLDECLKGPAREAVEGWLDAPTSVPLVIKTLQRLYGRPSLVVKDLLEKVRRTAAPRPENLDELITFGLTVQHFCDYLSKTDLEHYLMNMEMLEEMVEKLPATRKLEWVRYSRKHPNPSLKEFGWFMEKLVDEACEVTKYTPPKTNPPKRVHHSHVHTHAATTPAMPQEEPEAASSRPHAVIAYQPPPCLNCGKTGHRVRQCEMFKRLSIFDRLAAVECWKLCHNCLSNHGVKPCRSRYTCGIEGCRERHHRLLHRPIQHSEPAQFQMHRNGSQTTLFHVVPVTLYNGDKRIDTHAFLDERSSLTLVESSLAESLGLEGVPDPLALSWTAIVERKQITSRKISLEISGRGDERRYSIAAAHTVNELSLPSNNVKIKRLLSSHYYLQGLPVKAYEDGVPRLLIGLEDVDLMKPLETRSGQPGEPIAVKTVLGWAVYGPLGSQVQERQAATCNVHNPVRQRCDDKDAALNETLRRYFTLEETGVSTYSEFLPKPKDIVRANEIL